MNPWIRITNQYQQSVTRWDHRSRCDRSLDKHPYATSTRITLLRWKIRAGVRGEGIEEIKNNARFLALAQTLAEGGNFRDQRLCLGQRIDFGEF